MQMRSADLNSWKLLMNLVGGESIDKVHLEVVIKITIQDVYKL